VAITRGQDRLNDTRILALQQGSLAGERQPPEEGRGHSFSDSTSVTLQVWIDLHHRDGRKTKWQSTSFADNLQAVQCFIEAYGANKALQGR
jgi:hypothetical protein